MGFFTISFSAVPMVEARTDVSASRCMTEAYPSDLHYFLSVPKQFIKKLSPSPHDLARTGYHVTIKPKDRRVDSVWSFPASYFFTLFFPWCCCLILLLLPCRHLRHLRHLRRLRQDWMHRPRSLPLPPQIPKQVRPPNRPSRRKKAMCRAGC